MDDSYRVREYEHKEDGCLVTFYGGEQLFFSYDEFYKYSLYDRDNPGRMSFTKLMEEVGKERAFSAGLKEVLKSAKPSGEVVKILVRAGHEEEYAKEAAQRLSEEGYIDDLKYAMSFVRKKVFDKNLSKNFTLREAVELGIPEEKVSEAFCRMDISDRDSCERAADKKMREMVYFKEEDTDDKIALSKKDRNRLMSYLGSKGFSFDLINDIIREKLTPESDLYD